MIYPHFLYPFRDVFWGCVLRYYFDLSYETSHFGIVSACRRDGRNGRVCGSAAMTKYVCLPEGFLGSMSVGVGVL